MISERPLGSLSKVDLLEALYYIITLHLSPPLFIALNIILHYLFVCLFDGLLLFVSVL